MVAAGTVITATVFVAGVPVQLAVGRSKMLMVPAAAVFTVSVCRKPGVPFADVAVVPTTCVYVPVGDWSPGGVNRYSRLKLSALAPPEV